jgi:hypothetical protein
MFKVCSFLQYICRPLPLVLVLFCIPHAAMPISPSGEVVAVIQATSASGPGGNRTLSVEKPIFSGDKIKTGANGEAQVRFLDDTRFVIGPRSNVVIDRYVFNPDKSLASVSINMTRGAFRFISGGGPKRAYKIRTPTATIGIRGTEVDVAVDRQLGTGVLVFKGAVQLCSRRSGQCNLVRSGCGAAVARPDGQMWSPNSGRTKSQLINTNFPLIQQQRRFQRGFRVNTRGCDQVGITPGKEPTPSQPAAPNAPAPAAPAPGFEGGDEGGFEAAAGDGAAGGAGAGGGGGGDGAGEGGGAAGGGAAGGGAGGGGAGGDGGEGGGGGDG